MLHSTWRTGALILALAVLIGGCGQKGDLYKPEPGQSAVNLTTQLPT